MWDQEDLTFEKHPLLKPEVWQVFVDTTTNAQDFEEMSQEMKEKRAKHDKPHRMGRKGYHGQRQEWDEEMQS